MSVRTSVESKRCATRSAFLAAAVVAAVPLLAQAQVNSVNLNFNTPASPVTVAATGFDGAYNFDPTGVAMVDGTLVILTLPGDTYGAYENEPDSAKNFFYSNMNVGARTVVEARVNAFNINANFHGGGIWVGTDQDHYMRLGIIHNSFENPAGTNGVTIEALRENEDRWRGPGDLYPNRPGFDIEGRALGIHTAADDAGNLSNAILRIVRDANAVAGYVSLDNGATFQRIGGATYSFNALATDATSLPIDNRTLADPNSPDRTSHTVETDRGGFKVGAYALGGGESQAGIQFDSFTALTGTPTWIGSASGEWTSDANWTAGLLAPTNIESTALLPTHSAQRNITVGSNVTLTNVRFESAAGTQITGTGEVRFDWFYFPSHPDYYTNGPGTVTVTAGQHQISAPTVIAHMHQFNVASGATLALDNLQASPEANLDAGIRKQGAGTLVVNALNTSNIDVQQGTLRVSNASGTTVSRVRSVSIAGGATPTAKLDLEHHAMVIDYDAGNSPLATVKAQIAAGYANGTQSGNGILSSTSVGADSNLAVGYAEAASLSNIPALFGTVDADAILLRVTYKGDTDLNNIVNFDDLLALAQNYDAAGSGKTWVQGDSNYDGIVNFVDLLSLAQNYGRGALSESELAALSSDFAADWALAQSMVPEPTSLLTLGLLAAVTRRRRH